MFNRPLLFLGVLVAAVVVPYVLLDDNLSKTAQTQLARLTGGGGKDQPAGGSILPWVASAEKPAAPFSPAPLSVPVRLEEALRFDITPPWVTARWPQVSTVAGDGTHMGLRVPLVTGTDPGDIAGSLTYYFDERHELARITLSGITGDETRIIAVATQQFGLRAVPTLAAGLYVTGDPARPTSSLQVSHLPMVKTANSYARAEIALDLRRGTGSTKTEPEPPPKMLPRDFRRW
jgi:hypothetical protein